MIFFHRWLFVLGFLTAIIHVTAFAEIRIDSTDRGWFDETGFNQLDNPNYFVGDGRGPIGGSSLTEARNFFIYDLSEVNEPIVNATLSLYVPPTVGYFSSDPFETYVLSRVENFSAEYVMTISDDIAVYDDLADGEVFATRDFGNFDVDSQIQIPLNAAAIDVLNAQRTSGDPLFAIGGSISTLNIFPDDEMIFAFSPEVPASQTQLIINMDQAPDADFNDDSQFDCLDVDALTSEIANGTGNTEFDLTGDGLVDTNDLDRWLTDAGAANLASGGAYSLGDANLDGNVDVSDFNLWNLSKFTATDAWCSGDFNADGSVDVSDFNLWNLNKFTSAEPENVPEPTGFLLIAVGLTALHARSRSATRELNDQNFR